MSQNVKDVDELEIDIDKLPVDVLRKVQNALFPGVRRRERARLIAEIPSSIAHTRTRIERARQRLLDARCRAPEHCFAEDAEKKGQSISSRGEFTYELKGASADVKWVLDGLYETLERGGAGGADNGRKLALPYVREHLPKAIFDFLKRDRAEPDDIESVQNAVNRAFALVNFRLWEKYTKSKELGASGCTAALILHSAQHIYLIVLGTERILLFGKEGRLLSEIRGPVPTDPREQKRIEQNGLFIQEGKVSGSLSTARAFGQFGLNQHRRPENDDAILSLPLSVYYEAQPRVRVSGVILGAGYAQAESSSAAIAKQANEIELLHQSQPSRICQAIQAAMRSAFQNKNIPFESLSIVRLSLCDRP